VKKKNYKWLSRLLILSFLFILLFWRPSGRSPYEKEETTNNQVSMTVSKQEKIENKDKSIQLDVPLENQFDPETLGNGCEVTALSMVLNYYGIETNKNELADKLNYVPLYVDDTHRGDPRVGFVGNIYGGDAAMGVAVEPIAKVAKQMVGDAYQVISGREKTFDEIIEVLRQGAPIWIIATLELQVPTDANFVEWPTQSGIIYETPLIHSVVITGIDGDKMYVNDPYGHKDREISREDLQEIYEQMGQQSLYLLENNE
jgi:uncharacterized protein YvpB